jgi:hypothetical protein
MKRRSAAAWVENEIMGELVPPELDYLVNRLKLINPAADTRLVIEHARKKPYRLSALARTPRRSRLQNQGQGQAAGRAGTGNARIEGRFTAAVESGARRLCKGVADSMVGRLR